MSSDVLWLYEPEVTVGFAGLAAIATREGLTVAPLEDFADPAAGDLVASDPTRRPTSLVDQLPRCHHWP